jgi:hypothetical protein
MHIFGYKIDLDFQGLGSTLFLGKTVSSNADSFFTQAVISAAVLRKSIILSGLLQ